jgi:SAM-dependent methyltransferase
MPQVPVFDQEHYKALNSSRSAFVSRFLPGWKSKFSMATAIDVGCGFGFFSSYLAELGFQVTGIDGRKENVRETQERNPNATIRQYDVEDSNLVNLGCYDFALCFGLLYHLENPFRAIRTLKSLTRHILLLEGMCIPGSAPIMQLLDEGATDDQGLNYVAFYPSEACIIKMLYRAGFPFVYGFPDKPEHADYENNAERFRYRTILVASNSALQQPGVQLAPEPLTPENLWQTAFARTKRKIRGSLGAVKRSIRPVTKLP